MSWDFRSVSFPLPHRWDSWLACALCHSTAHKSAWCRILYVLAYGSFVMLGTLDSTYETPRFHIYHHVYTSCHLDVLNYNRRESNVCLKRNGIERAFARNLNRNESFDSFFLSNLLLIQEVMTNPSFPFPRETNPKLAKNSCATNDQGEPMGTALYDELTFGTSRNSCYMFRCRSFRINLLSGSSRKMDPF